MNSLLGSIWNADPSPPPPLPASWSTTASAFSFAAARFSAEDATPKPVVAKPVAAAAVVVLVEVVSTVADAEEAAARAAAPRFPCAKTVGFCVSVFLKLVPSLSCQMIVPHERKTEQAAPKSVTMFAP